MVQWWAFVNKLLTFGFLKSCPVIDQLNKYQLLIKDSAPSKQLAIKQPKLWIHSIS
jgi:hypothetical protein